MWKSKLIDLNSQEKDIKLKPIRVSKQHLFLDLIKVHVVIGGCIDRPDVMVEVTRTNVCVVPGKGHLVSVHLFLQCQVFSLQRNQFLSVREVDCRCSRKVD